LQLWDEKEVSIRKKVELWENDPVLHPCLGQKVIIQGKWQKPTPGESEQGLDYTAVFNKHEPLKLGLKTNLKDNKLWINKTPGPAPEFPPEMKRLTIRFSVKWPFRGETKNERSIWTGHCPTNQLYDFWIETPQGKMFWRWGQCMAFKNEDTEVRIPGGSAYKIKVPWYYFEDSIVPEGMYVLCARFIASEQIIRKPLWIAFAY
jgi:hypothetical protein